MVVQAPKMNADPPKEKPSQAIARGVGDLGQDLLTLVELQANLAVEDARAALKGSAVSLLLAVVALGLAVGGLPMLLLALAEGLVRFAGAERWFAYSLVAILALAISAALAVFAGRKVMKAIQIFNRSKDELARNFQWLKLVLKKNGRKQDISSPVE